MSVQEGLLSRGLPLRLPFFFFFVTGQMKALFAVAQTCLPEEEGLLGIASGLGTRQFRKGEREGRIGGQPQRSSLAGSRIASCAAPVLGGGRTCSFLSVWGWGGACFGEA